jgi:hypothetical protein
MPARKKETVTTRKKKTVVRRKSKPHTIERLRPGGLNGLIQDLGFLRVSLVIMTVLVMVGAPKPGTAPILEGWGMWTTLLTPTLAPILFMVLMLDALMGRVMLGSAQGHERARYRRIVAVNLVTGIALLLWWLPYFMTLFSAR